MKWQRNPSAVLGGWRTAEVETPNGRGYWRVRKKSMTQYHLNLMETREIFIGAEMTTSIYHELFDSLQSAKAHAERQQKT